MLEITTVTATDVPVVTDAHIVTNAPVVTDDPEACSTAAPTM